jgi:hypothetical protein
MNDQTDTLDQTDEDILSYSVSDDAQEVAAGMQRGVQLLSGEGGRFNIKWRGGSFPIDEDIFTYTVSDEALEAAGIIERGVVSMSMHPTVAWCVSRCC